MNHSQQKLIVPDKPTSEFVFSTGNSMPRFPSKYGQLAVATNPSIITQKKMVAPILGTYQSGTYQSGISKLAMPGYTGEKNQMQTGSQSSPYSGTTQTPYTPREANHYPSATYNPYTSSPHNPYTNAPHPYPSAPPNPYPHRGTSHYPSSPHNYYPPRDDRPFSNSPQSIGGQQKPLLISSDMKDEYSESKNSNPSLRPPVDSTPNSNISHHPINPQLQPQNHHSSTAVSAPPLPNNSSTSAGQQNQNHSPSVRQPANPLNQWPISPPNTPQQHCFTNPQKQMQSQRSFASSEIESTLPITKTLTTHNAPLQSHVSTRQPQPQNIPPHNSTINYLPKDKRYSDNTRVFRAYEYFTKVKITTSDGKQHFKDTLLQHGILYDFRAWSTHLDTKLDDRIIINFVNNHQLLPNIQIHIINMLDTNTCYSISMEQSDEISFHHGRPCDRMPDNSIILSITTTSSNINSSAQPSAITMSSNTYKPPQYIEYICNAFLVKHFNFYKEVLNINEDSYQISLNTLKQCSLIDSISNKTNESNIHLMNQVIHLSIDRFGKSIDTSALEYDYQGLITNNLSSMIFNIKKHDCDSTAVKYLSFVKQCATDDSINYLICQNKTIPQCDCTQLLTLPYLDKLVDDINNNKPITTTSPNISLSIVHISNHTNEFIMMYPEYLLNNMHWLSRGISTVSIDSTSAYKFFSFGYDPIKATDSIISKFYTPYLINHAQNKVGEYFIRLYGSYGANQSFGYAMLYLYPFYTADIRTEDGNMVSNANFIDVNYQNKLKRNWGMTHQDVIEWNLLFLLPLFNNDDYQYIIEKFKLYDIDFIQNHIPKVLVNPNLFKNFLKQQCPIQDIKCQNFRTTQVISNDTKMYIVAIYIDRDNNKSLPSLMHYKNPDMRCEPQYERDDFGEICHTCMDNILIYRPKIFLTFLEAQSERSITASIEPTIRTNLYEDSTTKIADKCLKIIHEKHTSTSKQHTYKISALYNPIKTFINAENTYIDKESALAIINAF